MSESDSFDMDSQISWSEDEEQLIKKLGEKAMANRVICAMAYERYSRMIKAFNVSIALVSGVTGLLSFASDKIPPTFTFWAIIVGIVSFGSTTLATVSQILKVAEKVGKFKYLENNWSHLSRDIEICLALARPYRPSFKSFILNLRTVYRRLADDMVDIDSSVISQFKSSFVTTNFELPERFGALKPLHIAPSKRRSTANFEVGVMTETVPVQPDADE